jgi:drug/metabolite transporter (DMT)-like permease
MSVILAYVFYFIASSASTLQARYITKKRDLGSNAQIRFVFQVVLIAFFGSLLFPFFSPFYLAGNPYYLILLTIVCGLFGALSNMTSMIAQKHLDAGVSTIVINIYTPITIILSSLFLHEGLNIMQVYGTILLLVAMVLVSKKHHIGKFKFDKYFLSMVLSGVLLGILLVAERWLQKMTGFSASIMLSWGAQALGLWILTLIYKSKHTYTNKEVITSGVFRFFGSLSYVILVYVVSNLSLVASVTTFKVVVVFAAGALILNEREDFGRKLFGSVLAVVGLLLLK